MPSGFWGTVRTNWPLIVGTVALLAWIVGQIVSASVTMADVNERIRTTESDVVEISKDLDQHEKAGSHPQINERLIRVETEVIHINTTQSQSFKDIKSQLNVMQDDIKDLGRN